MDKSGELRWSGNRNYEWKYKEGSGSSAFSSRALPLRVKFGVRFLRDIY